jgi:hypothetical protein
VVIEEHIRGGYFFFIPVKHSLGLPWALANKNVSGNPQGKLNHDLPISNLHKPVSGILQGIQIIFQIYDYRKLVTNVVIQRTSYGTKQTLNVSRRYLPQNGIRIGMIMKFFQSVNVAFG